MREVEAGLAATVSVRISKRINSYPILTTIEHESVFRIGTREI